MLEEVQSQEDFKLFIDNIYKSFYESLDSKIKNKKIDGEPQIIVSITDKIHQKLRLIKDFRNSFFHDKDSALSNNASADSRYKAKNDKKRLVEHYQNLIGVSLVEENDRAGWSGLQLAIIKYLRDLLFEIREIYRRSENRNTVVSSRNVENALKSQVTDITERYKNC